MQSLTSTGSPSVVRLTRPSTVLSHVYCLSILSPEVHRMSTHDQKSYRETSLPASSFSQMSQDVQVKLSSDHVEQADTGPDCSNKHVLDITVKHCDAGLRFFDNFAQLKFILAIYVQFYLHLHCNI